MLSFGKLWEVLAPNDFDSDGNPSIEDVLPRTFATTQVEMMLLSFNRVVECVLHRHSPLAVKLIRHLVPGEYFTSSHH